jgi:hypothetical protein
MRVLSIVVIGFGIAACGGVTDDPLGDGGGDAKSDSPASIVCNGSPCNDYCIHPSASTCPTCTEAPDSGTCPSGSTLENDCPAGPAMPVGQYCVTYPSAGPDYCSKTIPSMCSFDTPPPAPADIQCMPELCGA